MFRIQWLALSAQLCFHCACPSMTFLHEFCWMWPWQFSFPLPFLLCVKFCQMIKVWINWEHFTARSTLFCVTMMVIFFFNCCSLNKRSWDLLKDFPISCFLNTSSFFFYYHLQTNKGMLLFFCLKRCWTNQVRGPESTLIGTMVQNQPWLERRGLHHKSMTSSGCAPCLHQSLPHEINSQDKFQVASSYTLSLRCCYEGKERDLSPSTFTQFQLSKPDSLLWYHFKENMSLVFASLGSCLTVHLLCCFTGIQLLWHCWGGPCKGHESSNTCQVAKFGRRKCRLNHRCSWSAGVLHATCCS